MDGGATAGSNKDDPVDGKTPLQPTAQPWKTSGDSECALGDLLLEHHRCLVLFSVSKGLSNV